jgi:hypothetical protein
MVYETHSATLVMTYPISSLPCISLASLFSQNSLDPLTVLPSLTRFVRYRTENGYSQLAVLTPGSFATDVTEEAVITRYELGEGGVTHVSCKMAL